MLRCGGLAAVLPTWDAGAVSRYGLGAAAAGWCARGVALWRDAAGQAGVLRARGRAMRCGPGYRGSNNGAGE